MASSIIFPNRGRYSGPINAYRQSGAAAVVRKYRDTNQDNKVVAFKTYRSDTTVNCVTLIRELYILRRLKHPCLVELQNAFLSCEDRPLRYPFYLNSMNLIYESMDMDLKSYLEIMTNTLSLDDIKEIVHQLLCGIHFCHSANVMHRDIKPANILVNIPKDVSKSSSASSASELQGGGGGGSALFSRPYRCTAKHCDFGLARVLESVLFPSLSSTERDMQTGDSQSASLDNLVLLEMDNERLCSSSPDNHDDCLDFEEDDGNNNNTNINNNNMNNNNMNNNNMNKNNNMNNNNNNSSNCSNCSSGGSTVFDSITTIPRDTGNDATPLNQNSIAFYEADNLQNLQHQPSVHVVTRYYRAPEVILVQTYTSAIDVWSIGCTLAELFAVHNERSSRGKRRENILFPGENGPSPAGSLLTEHFALRSGSRDQLTIIIEKLGSKAVNAALPSYSVQAQALITKRLEQERHITEDGVSLAALYPTIPQQGIDLLSRLLDFNPSTRIRAEDALKHPFFTTRCGIGSEFIKNLSLESIAEQPLSADDASSIESQDRALQEAVMAEIDYWEQTHYGSGGGRGGSVVGSTSNSNNIRSSLHPN